MPSKRIQKAINEQIQNEFYASYLYLSMSAYCEVQNFPGFAHWMRAQSEEEMQHAMKLFDYLNNRGGRVILQAIERPPFEFKSPLDMFKQALEHEQKVTKVIHSLYKIAKNEDDYATEVELQWFIKEQVEEEKTTANIVDRLQRIEDDTIGALMLDQELGSRSLVEG